MCWDEKTSLLTFVIGTSFNIYNILHYKNTTITIISLLWQWVLFMQVFEYFAWKNQPKNGKCNQTNKTSAKFAYIANMTQPIILGLLFLAFQKGLSTENKVLAITVIMSYIGWVLYAANKAPEVSCLKKSDNCRNLNYSWWNDYLFGAGPYMIALFSLIFLLVKPFKFAVIQALFISISLLVSMKFYSCGTASMWCWIAAFAPLLVGPMWKMSQ